MSTLTYEQAAQRLLEGDGYLILTHVRPDGDTVGCAAALCTALREQGKEAYVLPNPELTAIFAPYLEGLLAPEGYQPKKVVSVDMAARGLFPENAQCYLEKVDLAFDHHPSQEFFCQGDLSGRRPGCLRRADVRCDSQWGSVSQAVALPLYVAVSTDTGCFVYSNTSPATHAVAAALLETGIDFYPINRRHFRTRSLKRLKLEGMLTSGMEVLDEGKLAIVTLTLDMIAQVQAKEEDLDDISAFVGGVEGVHTGVTIRELRPGVCKISLRTEPGELNASAVCAILGGGGHAAAAGATVEGDPAYTRKVLVEAIRQVQSQGK